MKCLDRKCLATEEKQKIIKIYKDWKRLCGKYIMFQWVLKHCWRQILSCFRNRMRTHRPGLTLQILWKEKENHMTGASSSWTIMVLDRGRNMAWREIIMHLKCKSRSCHSIGSREPMMIFEECDMLIRLTENTFKFNRHTRK